jgi:Conjugal transfer protein
MKFLMLFTIGGLLPIFAFAHIHSVKMKPDQILVVKTAIGIATIIETPESIQSAIIGDQSGFKVEYLDHAVTIKPLRAGARTNLYLQTANRRYDLRLEASHQDSADYIVYLKASDAHGPILWKDFSKSVAGTNLTLKCVRVARLPNGFLLVDLRLNSNDKEKLLPENVWLRQGKDSKIINGLFLSKLEISKDRPVMIGLTLLKSDLVRDHAVQISVKGDHDTLKMELPAEVLWK